MAVANTSSAAGLLNIERELQCFICTELLYQPLTLIDCLHTYCGACLKEWFGHQHRKASSSRSSSTANPYTCPTCRATVKDARHDARVATLLDMLLTANPGRGRTKEEEAEQQKIYKPGDNILPKVEHRRRRDGRSRRDEEDVEAQERRQIEEARQRSLRDLDNRDPRSGTLSAPARPSPRSRSRDHEERRTRRRDQENRRRREDVAESIQSHGRGSNAAETVEVAPLLPPRSSPRHPDAVEARQRENPIAHQPSLVSLISASDGSTGTGDSFTSARILQEIVAEGLLDGINVDELTEQETDELSERIAEAYRQRHQRTIQPASTDGTAIATAQPATPPPRVNRPDPAEENVERRQIRSQSHQPSSNPISGSRGTSVDARRPPASRPHLLDPTEISSTPRSSAHRRRASDQARRPASPSVNSRRTDATATIGATAARSATDLSNTPSTDRAAPRERPQQLSDDRRTNTDPPTNPRVSDLWRQGGQTVPPSQTPEANTIVLPIRSLNTDLNGLTSPKESINSQQRTILNDPQPHNVDGTQSGSATTSPRSQKSPLAVLTRFQEPSISCARCARQEIQYTLYKHCSTCKMDLCLRCYRDSRGCNHWYGFGQKAQANFLASQSAGQTSETAESPHVLVGRKYIEAPPETIQAPGIPMRSTTSNPAERLQEGHFCDRCHSFANACFWSCEYCNEGEWGFCNDCVNKHQCCVHPLLPLAHRAFAPKSPSAQDQAGYDPHLGNIAMTPADLNAAFVSPRHASRPSTSGSGAAPSSLVEHPDYVTLSFTTYCDICSKAILPEDHRFHCPSHPSPTPQQPTKTGDYDICIPCYHQLVDTGRIKRDDGPSGWRKCPGGHRMIVVAFEEDTYLHQRRIVQRDLVGGQCLDPKETVGPRSRAGSMNASGSRFPPEGGVGKTYAAMWSFYPEEGSEGTGELMFPKWAEIHECEDQNEDWAYGVYMGNKGLVPRAYVREWNRTPF